MEKNLKKNIYIFMYIYVCVYICIYMHESLCYTPEILQINCTSIKIFFKLKNVTYTKIFKRMSVEEKVDAVLQLAKDQETRDMRLVWFS